MKTVNESSFDSEVLQSEKPVVVDFGAEWCAPCRGLKPVLEAFAASKNIDVVYVDIDDNSSLSSKYNVMSIPTVCVFKNGELVDRRTGKMSADMLSEFIDPHFA